MALGSEAPASFKHSGRMTAVALLLVVCVTLTQSAPMTYDEIEARRIDLTDYFNDPNGCYYNYQHYEEGDRIVTNEPCLNCTCHNRMLMCYLRVCPFSKAIGQDCTVQKSPDQCCPTISCPEVPVHLLTSSTTHRPTTTTEIGWHDNYGCIMNDNEFLPDGAQVPSDLKKPCELCYCIRNRTACVMQECTLHVEGCRPVYQDSVCCPVRYDCDYENEKSTTTAPQISGGLVFSTTSAPFDCRVNDDVYRDGESIAMVSEKPCQHCYCMRGDIVCAIQDCGEPLRGKHCTPETPPTGQCCPTSYQCANETISSDDITTLSPASQSDTDENEAEKYPTNEDIYDKLGKHQPSQDDTNKVNSDHVFTTLVYNNEISSVESSDQTTYKNEEIKNPVSSDNHNVVEKPNILPPSDNVNIINEENKQEILNNKPELTNQVNIISTEFHQTKYESTDKPVEPTLVEEAQPTESLPADVQSNKNVVSPTIQTISYENNNVKINEENNDNKSPVENTSQNDLISNLPVATTDNSIESETQSFNLKDHPQEGIQQQIADTPSVVPVKSNNDGHGAETKPQTEITFNKKQDPPKQSNEENSESYTEENKIQTNAPLSEDTEQTTHKLTQHDNEKAPLEESNIQTDTSSNNGQNFMDTNNQDINQLPQEDNNSHSENTSGENVSNNGKPQVENESSTEIPEVENEPTEQNNLPVDGKPPVQNQPGSENKPIELNQDSLQENVSPTEIPRVENAPTEQNQNSSPVENESSTEIPKIVNKPIEQNNLPVDGTTQVENQPESQTSHTEQNQNNPLVENETSTEIPKVENEPTQQNINIPVENKPQPENQPESQNAPTEQNQDSLQKENISPTGTPNIENKPTKKYNLPVDGKPPIETQPESQTSPTKQNQDSPPVENKTSTEIPKIVNEPTEQNNLPVDGKLQIETQPESQNSPTNQNQDSPSVENESSTDISKIKNEPTGQNNNIPAENKPQTENQPNSQNAPTEQNQNNLQENVSPTEIPKIENQQNNLPVENKPQIETQPESQNIPVEQNQNNPQIENVPPTEIPSKLNEPQSENITPTKPSAPAVSQNDVSTEQSNENNNIFVVSLTSPPLFSQNQIKGEELTSVLNENDNSDKYSSTEKNLDTIIENSQPSADDKTSPAENTNTDNVSTITSTEVTPENNGSPQTNDENTEQSTETKLIKNEVNNGIPNDKSNSTVNSHGQTPINEEHNDKQNKPDNAKPMTETNYDVNSETTIQSILVGDTSSQEHQQGNEHSVDKENQSIPNADSVEQQNALQTETFTEVGTSENENPSSVDEHLNDVTTSLPQQQITDYNTPVKSEDVNPSVHNATPDETKMPNNLSVNNTPKKTTDNHLPSEIQHSNGISNSTESPVLDTSNVEQSTNIYPSEQNNDFENITPHGQSQDENVNEVLDQTSVYPDILSGDKNELNIATGSNQSNEENVTPLSDILENDTNAQDIGKEPVKNVNKDGIEIENTTTLQTEQINHESSENANNVDNLVPSVAPNKDAPSSQAGENDVSSSPTNPPSNIETNNNQPENVGSQQSVNSDETSTQYNIDDTSTNSPIQESPNTNVNNNAETSTNVPSNLEIPNEINQDSITELELYPTQSPTEKNTLSADSNKTPDNDATMEVITNLPGNTNSSSEINGNEIIDKKSSENPQNAGKPSTPVTPNYVIDTTTYSPSELSNNVPESINTENEINEATTFSVDKNNEMTTELYENIQPGVPGEGSCLINFVTYAHKAEVPKSNPCHEKCECLNSIVTCTSVNCPPAPPQHRNCIPLHPGNESWCCPTYMCEGRIEGILFEGNNQLGSPQLIPTVLLEDKPGEENYEKTPIDEEVPGTSSPQITLEYNTLAPSNSDTNSDVNSQDPTQTEIPNKQIEDSVGTNGENNIPVTTIINETVENENDRPIESDKSSENEKLDGTSEKPIENELSENEKPVENDKLEENDKPVENHSAEPEKPINSSEADFITISYEDNLPIVTNKPDTSNNIEGQNTLSNSDNESQYYPVPSTEIPSYESTIINVLPTNDQNQPESNSGLENSITATTFEPNDSVVEQQVDNNKSGANEPTVNEQSNASPVDYVTDLPESNVNPLEITHTPVITDDTKPMLVENNADGLRPSSIDDIISSVNMIKDAVKNSLETLSKPVENNYQTTEVIENHQPTTVPEYSASPLSENSLSDKYNEPQTAVNGTSIAPELQTDVVDEKSTENPTAVQPSDKVGATQVPTSSPSANTDQGVSTDLPLYVPTKQKIPASTSNGDVNQAGEIADDETPEITTTKYSSDSPEQISTSNGPETSGDSIALQVNVESNANPTETVVVDDKSPEINSTQALPSAAQHEGILVDDQKPAAEEKPNTESPVLPDSDMNNDNAATGAVPAHAAVGHPTTAPDDNTDKRFGGEPSSSPAPSVAQDDKRPQESSETVNAPTQSDTEKPPSKPSASTPSALPHRPSYTPIPQSTWTQKPFHHDSTSEAPQQPDQSFPDDYDDENEAVYGSGTCRYGGKVYVSAQQVPRDDPCDFCFCFRSDIICLQQSCPPPIFGCYQENINGFCCPRYECPVAQATSVNVTTTTTTTTTMVPPHFFANDYRGAARRAGCLIHGHAYRVGEDVGVASGPCLECICGANGKMKCDPKSCSPEPLLRKMLVEAVNGQTGKR